MSNERSSRRGNDDNERSSRSADRGASRSRSRDNDDAPAKSRSGSFSYRERDRSEVTRRAEAKGANEYDKFVKDEVKTYKPADGDNRIRILPPTWDNAKHFGLDIHVHYGVGPDKATYLCLQKMKGSADPIEEEWQDARRGSDEEYTKQLESKKRVLVYLIDRNNEKEGVQVWAMPWTVDRDIVKVSVDRSNGEVLPIDHPEEGFDVEFSKTGKASRTEYSGVAVARRSTPLGKDAWLDYAVDNPLPTQLVYYEYDYIASVFHGKSAKAGTGDEQQSARKPAAAREQREEVKDSALTWDDVHSMSGAELDDLVEQERLDITVEDAKDDEDLANWICEEMGIKKVERARNAVQTGRSRASASADEDDDESAAVRLRKMRSQARG